jgi:glycosyltransferase involved in cell wall biosynthesis
MSDIVGEKVSACLLTYNHVNLIESTLESILDQTIRGYEVIVSDDCSTDGTWECIVEVAKRDGRIRPLRTPHNMGMPGNANFAVAQSDRPYIALLHHDDIYRRDLLEKWADILERYPGVSVVFNPYDTPNAEHHYGSRLDAECVDGSWFLEKRLFARWGCPVRGTAMIRRSWWERVGGMREQFDLLADVDLWMRLSSVSQVGYVPEPLLRVRQLRPDYYPEIYKGTKFTWRRTILAYEIHGSNRLDYLDLRTFKGKWQWWGFRLKLSFETTKWLIYGIVKERYEIISSNESVTRYDLLPLRLFRSALQLIVASVPRSITVCSRMFGRPLLAAYRLFAVRAEKYRSSQSEI